MNKHCFLILCLFVLLINKVSAQSGPGASSMAFKLLSDSAVNNIHVTWERDANVSSYRVLRGISFDQINTIIYEGSATFIDDYGLDATDSDEGTTYYYQVRGKNVFGTEFYVSRVASATVFSGEAALALYDNEGDEVKKHSNETKNVESGSTGPGGFKVPDGNGSYDYYQYAYQRLPVTLTVNGSPQERTLFRGYTESKYNFATEQFESTGNVFLQPGRTRVAADAQIEHLYTANDRYTDPVSLQYQAESFADTNGTYSALDFCKLEAVHITYNEFTNSIILWGHYENPYNYSTAAAFSASWVPGDSTYVTEWYSGALRPYGHASRDISYFIDKNDSLDPPGLGYAAYILFASNRKNADGTDAGTGANHTMMIQKLESDYKKISAEQPVPILVGGFREAPSVIYTNDMYYLFSSGAYGWLPSPTAVITAPTMLGPWTGMMFIGNSTTFSGQSHHIKTVSANGNTTYALHANRWWRTSDAPSSRLFPLAINGDYANFDYYPNLYINSTIGHIVPERRGMNVAFGKPATSSRTGATILTALTDQNYDSEWNAGTRSAFSVTIDLEQEYQLESMEISWGLRKGSESWFPFKIYGSKNAEDYTLLYDGSTRPSAPKGSNWGFDAPILNNGESSSVGRYIKLEVGAASKSADGRGLSWAGATADTRINELRVMASMPEGVGLNFHLKKDHTLDVYVFPNPFSEQITFRAQSNNFYELTIFNALGKEVSSYSFNGNELKLDGSQLSPGIYMYLLRDGEGRIKSGKLSAE
jgi:hypothetical protein